MTLFLNEFRTPDLSYAVYQMQELDNGVLIHHLMLSLKLQQNSETFRLNGFVTFIITLVIY